MTFLSIIPTITAILYTIQGTLCLFAGEKVLAVTWYAYAVAAFTLGLVRNV